MGREVRRAPPTWEHPKTEDGYDRPLLGRSFREAMEEFATDPSMYEGIEPSKEEYMPEWSEEEKTHLQMYENTTEGTPISPVMESPESLARWLADNGASAFGPMMATYEEWLATIRRGWALSAMASQETGVISGVAAEKFLEDKAKDPTK